MPTSSAPESTDSLQQPALSFGQIWNMCFGFLGIQFGWGLQMANMSAIFEHLGATRVAGLWLAAPLTGLLVQPIVGYLSDRTWHPKLGRRRPYFLVGALLSSAALILMPNSSALWMAAGLLWVLDASINISMEPFRAFVADKLPPRQRTLGFTTQSFFIGVGAVLASTMPFVLTNWFGVENESDGNSIPTSVKLSFYIGAVAFLGAVLYTIFTTKEYPPDKEAASHESNSKGFLSGVKEIFGSISNMPRIMRQLAPVQFFTWMGLFCMWIFFGVTIARSVFGYQEVSDLDELRFETLRVASEARLTNTMDKESNEFKSAKKEVTLFFNNPGKSLPTALGTDLTNLSREIEALRQAQPSIFADLNKKLEQQSGLDWAKLQSWASASDTDLAGFVENYRVNRKKYSDGIEWGGNCFALYSVITFLVAFLIPPLAKRIGMKRTHSLCLLFGAAGLIAIWVIRDKYALFGSMVGVGIAWASILSMPYAMLSTRVPARKMGIYMGIFNFFIVIPEIITALSFDWILEHVYDMNRSLFVATGGLLMLFAALLTLRLKDTN